MDCSRCQLDVDMEDPKGRGTYTNVEDGTTIVGGDVIVTGRPMVGVTVDVTDAVLDDGVDDVGVEGVAGVGSVGGGAIAAG